MPSLQEEKLVHYTVKQLYEMVLDVEKYPEFLPWCSAVRVDTDADLLMEAEQIKPIIADMIISYKAFSESYRSKIIPTHAAGWQTALIKVEAISGPFEHLDTEWRFTSQGGLTIVNFSIDFRLKSGLLDGLMGIFFAKICDKMMAAFLARAEIIYGNNTK